MLSLCSDGQAASSFLLPTRGKDSCHATRATPTRCNALYDNLESGILEAEIKIIVMILYLRSID